MVEIVHKFDRDNLYSSSEVRFESHKKSLGKLFNETRKKINDISKINAMLGLRLSGFF